MRKYIYGLVTGLFLIPIAEEFLPVIQSCFEVLKCYPTKIILKNNEEIRKIQEDSEQKSTVCHGFAVLPSQENAEK